MKGDFGRFIYEVIGTIIVSLFWAIICILIIYICGGRYYEYNK